MHLKQLKRIVSILEELDTTQQTLQHSSQYHPAIKDAMIGGLIQLRASMLDRVKQEHGLDIEV